MRFKIRKNLRAKNKMPYAVAARLATDTARAARLIGELNTKPELAAKLGAKLEELRVAALKPDLKANYGDDIQGFNYRLKHGLGKG